MRETRIEIKKTAPVIILALFFIAGLPAYAYLEPPVRVALGTGLSKATITSDGKIELREEHNGVLIDTIKGHPGAGFVLKGDIIKSSAGRKGEAFLLRPKDGLLAFDGKEYRGTILVALDEGGMSVVNILPMEQYLRGVVAEEMPPGWEEEALKAQAVAARTYALNRLGQYENRPFDLYGNVYDQVYDGVAGEDPRSDDAVRATRGLALTYDGEPIIAYYSAATGGASADSSDVFGKAYPYLRSVLSREADSFRWTLDVTSGELSKALKTLGLDIGKPREIQIHRYAESGYVLTLKVIGAKGAALVPAAELRKLLGPNRMKSTRFAIGDGKFPPINMDAARADNSQASGRAPEEVLIKLESETAAVLASGGVAETTLYSDVVICSAGKSYLGDDIYALGRRATGFPMNDIFTLVHSPGDETVETTFEPVEINGSVKLIGMGFGHGVGMSQYGAQAFAADGWNFKEILLHYYTGVELRRLYE